MRNLLRKPATIEYPYQETEVEPDIRGRHYADLTKCIGCSLCSIECPADAITMTKIPEGYEVPAKNRRGIYPVIDYMKCVYCYRCITVCPTDAYVATDEFRLATDAKPVDSSVLSLKTLRGGKQ